MYSPPARQFAATGRILASSVIFFATCCLSSSAQAEVQVEAFAGAQMGVGRVTIDLPAGDSTSSVGDDRFTLREQSGRVLYPAAHRERERKILRRVLGIETPRELTIYFLFLGDAPLELDVYTPERVSLTVNPQRNNETYANLLNDWWEQYLRLYQRVHDTAEYPVGTQTYLTAMCASRLGREMPNLEGQLLRDQGKGGTTTGQILSDEAYRASVLRDLMLDRWAAESPSQPNQEPPAANLPLPSARLPVTTANPPANDAEIVLEPMASHVPAECFYVRFGTFSNYLWFRDFMKRWQGDLGNMLVLRSVRRNAATELSTRLCLKESTMGDMLGPQVIEDVAIVGMDPYIREGAAIGVLFQAKNSFLLSASFAQSRRNAVANHPRATDEQVEVAGQAVSFVSSPDGVLHSYYATDGQYHLVTTSRAMVERFYAAGKGEDPLSGVADFLAARQSIGIDRDDTVFVHLSAAFLSNLTSPAYRIELQRRLRAAEATKCVQLGTLVAAQEGFANESLDDLVHGGYLSESVVEATKLATADSPLADNLPTSCTPGEQRAYLQFVEATIEEAGALVPVTASVHRQPLPGGDAEQINVELNLQRYSTTNLAAWAKKLAAPAQIRLAPIAGDLISGEVVLQGMAGSGEAVHLFGGLRDGFVPLDLRGGSVSFATSALRAVEGYVGAWPKPQMLERLLGRPRGPFDNQGIAPAGGVGGLLDLWIRRADDFLLFSFKRNVLAEVGNQLAMVDAARPAQGWLTVHDLVGTQYEQVAAAYGYARSRQTSASASRFMNSLVEQLNTDPATANQLASELTGGEFVCPLGGEYVLVEVPGGVQAWTSSAMSPSNRFLLTEIPADYRFPVLEWFRGMTVELVRGEDSLQLAAQIVVSETRPAALAPPTAGPPPGEVAPPPEPQPSTATAPEELPAPAAD